MHKKNLYAVAFWVTVVFWFVACYLLFAKNPYTGIEVPAFGAHILLFFVLSYMTTCAQYRPRLFLTWALICLFGMISEIIQYFDPPRTCDVVDFFEDVIGTSLGIGAAVLTLILLRYFLRSALGQRLRGRKKNASL
ncbi:MAG: VanZ family protein [Planctomycetaceae bacterium]|nr:VanZ family protein [Planctomycetaceae bacterium]